MKVLNTSIIKTQSVKDAIHQAINEWFNKAAIENYTQKLVIIGNVGVCERVEIEDLYECNHTSYFIVTDLSGDLKRVEYCTEMQLNWY